MSSLIYIEDFVVRIPQPDPNAPPRDAIIIRSSANRIAFMGTRVDGRSPVESVLITNAGNKVLNISHFSVSPRFLIINSPKLILEPWESTRIDLVFEPNVEGVFSGSLTINSNANGGTTMITLSGVGLDITNENPDPDPGPGPDPDPEPVTDLKWLRTSGRKIFDEDDNQFIFRSINWYGFEQIGVPGGAWTRPFRTKVIDGAPREGMLDEIKRLGFNSIRLLVNEDITWAGHKPTTTFGAWNTTFISPDMNPEFLNNASAQNPQDVKTSIEIMDLFVRWCEELELRIVFDLHCLAPDDSNILGTNGKWYTTATPTDPGETNGVRREPRNEQQAIDALVFLANRYKTRPVVCGIDLINEPHACTWDRHPLTGVVGFYERCGNAILNVNPNLLIFCEGVAELGMNDGTVDHTPVGYENTTESLQGLYRWGVIWSGKLDEVARINNIRVNLNYPNRVVYSPHEYGAWFDGPNLAHQWFHPEVIVPNYPGDPFPDNMPEVWRRQWGYLAEENIAPIWIGEFGSYLRIGGDPAGGGGSSYAQIHLDADIAWLNKLAEYCAQWDIGWAFWAWNPGGDPDGLVRQNPVGTWHEAQQFKLDALAGFLPEINNEPGNKVHVSVTNMGFGDIQIGKNKSLTLVVSNLGGDSVVTSITTSSPEVTVTPSVFVLAGGSTANVSVKVSPLTVRSGTEVLTFNFGGVTKTTNVSFNATEEPAIVGPAITLPANAQGIVTIGDSITWGGFYENNGWCSQACFQYNQAYRYRGTFAVIGSTSTQAKNDQLPSVLAMDPPPKACVIATGTNNVFQVSQGTNDVKDICDILIANNIYPILWTVPPRNDFTTSDGDIISWNNIIRDYGEEMGLSVVDSFEAWRVPGSNRLNSEYDYGDGLHINTFGYGQLGKWIVDNNAFGLVPNDGLLVLNPVSNKVPNGNFLDSNGDGVSNNMTLGTGMQGSIVVDPDGTRWQRLVRPGSVVGSNVSNTIAPFAITGGKTYSFACKVRWDTGGDRAAIEGASWTAVASILFTDTNWSSFPNGFGVIFGTDGGPNQSGVILRDDLVAPAGANRMVVNLLVVQDGVAVKSEDTVIEFSKVSVVEGRFPLSGINPNPPDTPTALLDSTGETVNDNDDLPLES